ncbi:MAG: hypothetical protein ACQEP4_09395, partial [Bacillota bacterium]
GSTEWSENKVISEELLEKLIQTKKTYLTVNWAGAGRSQDDVDIASLKSVFLVPMIANDKVKAIIYGETGLRNKDFSSSDIAAVEVLSGVFSINLV